MRVRASLAAAVILASVACVNPFAPAPPGRTDPGTVLVQVRDDAGAPVANAWVYVELPNEIGSYFKEGQPTPANGDATFVYIPAGRRPFEIKAPAGYTLDADWKHDVDVVKGKTVTTRFVLHRS